MMVPASTFATRFRTLTGLQPFAWQTRLFARFQVGEMPEALDTASAAR
jgi:hypothetical protein